MSNLQVEIVTPERQVFTGTAQEVRFPAWNGEVGVLPGHENYLSQLRGGLVTVISEGKETKFIVGRGFAEAGPDHVSLLTNSCTDSGDVDKAGANKSLQEAQSGLAESSTEDMAWQALEERMEIALAQLSL